MKFAKVSIAIFLLLCLFIVSVQEEGQGQETAPEGLAVALIIDSSGSMKENDPNHFRIEAAKKVVSLLGDNDQVSVVEFSNQATVLIPLRKVGDNNSRKEILSKLDAMGANGDTDIAGGLSKAFAELGKADTGRKRLALLLSDGEPDLPQLLKDPKMMADYLANIDKIAGQYKTNNWAVHCVALKKAESGLLLNKIAQQTGGEYYFVKDTAELTNFFQSILLVQKYSDTAKPELTGFFDKKSFKVNETFPVHVSLKVGTDTLVAGPHLKLDSIRLHVIYANQETEVIDLRDDGQASSGDAQAGDGIYSAIAKCAQKGEMLIDATAQGTYRSQVFNDKLEVGKIQVKPEFSFLEQSVINIKMILLKYQYIVTLILTAVIFFMIALILFKRLKDRDDLNLKGTLQYWVEDGNISDKKTINLAKTGKGEIVVSTEKISGIDFVLPLNKRSFTFKIKKFIKNKTNIKDIKEFNLIDSDIFYWAISVPGTYLVVNDTPKSRQQIFNDNVFSVGGYVFKFECREAKAR
jgi:hypothetical protein